MAILRLCVAHSNALRRFRHGAKVERESIRVTLPESPYIVDYAIDSSSFVVRSRGARRECQNAQYCQHGGYVPIRVSDCVCHSFVRWIVVCCKYRYFWKITGKMICQLSNRGEFLLQRKR